MSPAFAGKVTGGLCFLNVVLDHHSRFPLIGLLLALCAWITLNIFSTILTLHLCTALLHRASVISLTGIQDACQVHFDGRLLHAVLHAAILLKDSSLKGYALSEAYEARCHQRSW